jgi:hypothetical protein
MYAGNACHCVLIVLFFLSFIVIIITTDLISLIQHWHIYQNFMKLRVLMNIIVQYISVTCMSCYFLTFNQVMCEDRKRNNKIIEAPPSFWSIHSLIFLTLKNNLWTNLTMTNLSFLRNQIAMCQMFIIFIALIFHCFSLLSWLHTKRYL